ncbi:RNA-dependent ATPase rok1 [Oleoguttula sp. CCFEE 5521]
MDALKLLSRSTNVRRVGKNRPFAGNSVKLPSSQSTAPQPITSGSSDAPPLKRRKRDHEQTPGGLSGDAVVDFFGQGAASAAAALAVVAHNVAEDDVDSKDSAANIKPEANAEATKSLLRRHKLKVTWLNAGKKKQLRSKASATHGKKDKQGEPVYPAPLEYFADLEGHFAISRRLCQNVREQGYVTATEVQLAALPLLIDSPERNLPREVAACSAVDDTQGIDLLTVAPTGSGKTLAFLLPLFHKIAQARRKEEKLQRRTTALILAPTKELVSQITNEARKLGANTGIQVAQVRKGMRLGHDRGTSGNDVGNESAVKVDILVAAPGTLHSILKDIDEEAAALQDVDTLVLDEADVLLDPLFREQTTGIWNRLSNPGLRVSLWSATMGSNIEELARSIIENRHKRLQTSDDAPARPAPLLRLVVGLKDSAVPNVEHKLIYAATEQGKLMGLRQLLHPTTSSREPGPHLRPPFIVFTQTIERAAALYSELLYDIPTEAGGIGRIAVLHSDLSDTARDDVMVRFRKGEIWVLITTDLLSRGVDFRGVNGVVNYDIPSSSAAYVHRVGRTGRAGREGGVAVTLYSKEDIPYMKHVANVVAVANQQKGIAVDGSSQEWLLRSLPKMTQNDKQKLKKHGVEARTSRGMAKDARGASKARISTKAGFIRRQENNRKGAVVGSQRRSQALANEDISDQGEETDFGGFD